MLVLSRKANETIRIGDSVTITILKTKGNTVRLGIDAPRDVRVMRGEISHIVKDESEADQAVQPVPPCSTTVPMHSRCAAESFFNPSEETRCAADCDESDRWSVSSMKRRVEKACAQRRSASA